MKGRRRGTIVNTLQASVRSLAKQSRSVDWMKVFKASFMLLFVAYPGKHACAPISGLAMLL